jgi:hypothetical protein
MWEQISGPNLCGVGRKTQRRCFDLEIMLYGFPREKRYTWANSIDGLVHSKYIIAYPIILFFFCFY